MHSLLITEDTAEHKWVVHVQRDVTKRLDTRFEFARFSKMSYATCAMLHAVPAMAERMGADLVIYEGSLAGYERLNSISPDLIKAYEVVEEAA